MDRPDHHHKTLIIASWALLAAGLALRIVFAALPPIATPDSDARYEPLAHNLAAGNGFSTASAPPYTPDRLNQPGYPAFLAAIELVAGDSRRAVVVVQLLVELVGVGCLLLLARRAGLAPPTQLAVAALALLCPVLPTIARAIWSETLATTALTATTLAWLLALRAPERRGPWLAAGAGSAVCLLIRPDLVPAVGLLFLVAAARGRRLRGLLLALAPAVVLLGAWSARNYVQTGSPSPLGGFTNQVDKPYIEWLGTWMDDVRFMAPYRWYVKKPTSPDHYPAGKVVDPDERARADAALAELRRGGSFQTPEMGALFTELTAEARAKRPLRTYLLVPLRRTALTWYNVAASYAKNLAVRGTWLLFLACALAGALWGCKHRTDLALLAGAVVVGRSLVPFTVGIGVEPRYVAEALPVCFLLTGLLVEAWRHARCSVPGA